MAAPDSGTADSLGRYPVPVVNFAASLLVATVMGFLAGMGVGGGSLLLLWLTQVVMLEQTQARIINLLFYLPAAIVASVIRKKQNKVAMKPAVWAIATGCTAALLLTLVSRVIDVTLLKKLLGGLLILTGIREVFYRPRKAR